MNGNGLSAPFISDARWDRLPPAVQPMARMALLDGLGATLVGTLTPIGRITAAHAESTRPGGEATIPDLEPHRGAADSSMAEWIEVVETEKMWRIA